MKAPLCKLEEIPDRGAKTIDFFGREALVFKVEGKPKAVLNLCMHLGGPMRLEGCKLVCEWHGAEFECTGGRCVKGPARPESRLIVLPTRVAGDILEYVFDS